MVIATSCLASPRCAFVFVFVCVQVFSIPVVIISLAPLLREEASAEKKGMRSTLKEEKEKVTDRPFMRCPTTLGPHRSQEEESPCRVGDQGGRDDPPSGLLCPVRARGTVQSDAPCSALVLLSERESTTVAIKIPSHAFTFRAYSRFLDRISTITNY